MPFKRLEDRDQYAATYYDLKGRESRKRIVQRNREIIRKAKDRPCADCAVAYPYYVMQFDHLPGTVKCGHLARAPTEAWSLDRLIAELAKCQIVCANCHAVRTHNRTIAG